LWIQFYKFSIHLKKSNYYKLEVDIELRKHCHSIPTFILQSSSRNFLAARSHSHPITIRSPQNPFIFCTFHTIEILFCSIVIVRELCKISLKHTLSLHTKTKHVQECIDYFNWMLFRNCLPLFYSHSHSLAIFPITIPFPSSDSHPVKAEMDTRYSHCYGIFMSTSITNH
jgi:hypothetical protein